MASLPSSSMDVSVRTLPFTLSFLLPLWISFLRNLFNRVQATKHTRISRMEWGDDASEGLLRKSCLQRLAFRTADWEHGLVLWMARRLWVAKGLEARTASSRKTSLTSLSSTDYVMFVKSIWVSNTYINTGRLDRWTKPNRGREMLPAPKQRQGGSQKTSYRGSDWRAWNVDNRRTRHAESNH